MIVYFADRQFHILGLAGTAMRRGIVISDDVKTEDIDTGVAVFECEISFNKKNRKRIEACTQVGNYLLRSCDGKNEFYTIIEASVDTKDQTVSIYAEDAGLDLLNEVVGEYEADKAYPISHYVNKFAYDSGFVIGVNEISGLTRKLSWDGEATCTERLASVATQFDNAEISYSFDIKGLVITNKYINIHKKRGRDIGIRLRLNQEIDRIITKSSIANLATALEVTGGTPEGSQNPITLNGYKYDDGDFYINGTRLCSRSALKKWSRYVWNNEPNRLGSEAGHIVKLYSYDTTSQKELCAHSVTQLKKICDPEVNYEVDIAKLPDNAQIGDTVYIIDNAGELYLSTRLLQMEVSETQNSRKATLGDFLIKESGISQKVADLAEKFSKTSISASKALAMANKAKSAADSANEQAGSALQGALEAKNTAQAAQEVADMATTSAANAQNAADSAKEAVSMVEQSVSSLETSLDVAQKAADAAQKAAETADVKAVEAKEAALEAQRQTVIAKESADAAQVTAETAVLNASTAQKTADTAKTQAVEAQATAQAAKLDAEQANKDIASLGDSLETLSSTMTLEYARKTDLTAAEAALQTQISQNAAEISSTAKKVQTIDETANNAVEQAALAQTMATAAKTKADQASADAVTAQTKANEAATAAANAQSEADKAKQAATAAQSVADKAEADLIAAKEDFATVSGRVDATEEEITAAQLAVETAQAAVDKAKKDAANAAEKAENAQAVADTAAADAASAQAVANDAASKAATAQKTADVAKGDAVAAQAKAAEAATAAAEAQRTADTAKTNAATAQTTADAAATQALTAQTAADDAGAKAVQAAADLEKAKKNLEDVTSRVDATAEEVEAAQAAVTAAQSAADKAQADAIVAQNTANTARENAVTAQTAADAAQKAADAAQTAASEAQSAADKAQADVDALAIRTTTAETKIQQNSEKIELAATKTEVAQTLGGYYTKVESDAAAKVVADEIKLSVSEIYATKDNVTGIDTRLKSAEADITTHANEIALAVKEVDVTGDYLVGKINLSSTTATISAKHIDLAGTVTIAMLADDTKIKLDTAASDASTALSEASNAQVAADAASARATYHYGICTTVASAAVKVGNMSGFVLYTGAKISIKFTNANTAANPTLNVNGTGAKPVRANGSNLAAASRYNWRAGSVVNFVYDGSCWVMEESTANYLWASNNDVTRIDGGNIYTKSIKAAAIDVEDLFAQQITATNLHITGNSTFEGELNAATGTFAGAVYAQNIAFDGYNCHLTSNNEIIIAPGGWNPNERGGPFLMSYFEALHSRYAGGLYTGMLGGTINVHDDINYVAIHNGDSETSGTAAVGFGVGTGGYNRGVYDFETERWMIYADKNNNTYINGAVQTSGVYKKFAGHVVVMDMCGTRPGTCPVGFRPSSNVSVPVIWGNGSSFYMGWVYVNAGGAVTFSYIRDDHSVNTPTSAFVPYGGRAWII